MSQGIEPAYAALGRRIADVLANTTFLRSGEDLEIDPSAPITPTGDEEDLQQAAALVTVRTDPVRQLLGRPDKRWVVERECRLELALYGPNTGLRMAVKPQVLGALASIPNDDPTLDGLVERLVLTGQTDDDLPPNGVSYFLTFVLRLRSGDPLGQTP